MAYSPIPISSKNIWDFDPTSIGGCTLWLDAADQNTLFSDIGGTIPSTIGGNVGFWRDKSVSSNNAIRNSNASYPTGFGTYASDNSVQFGGSAAYTLTVSALPTGTTSGTYFVVSKSTSGTNTGVFCYGGTTTNLARALYYSTTTTANLTTNPDGTSSISTTVSGTNIITYMYNNFVQSGWSNGTSFSTNNNRDLLPPVSAVLFNTGTTVALLGALFNTTGLNGNIYEILVYNTALSNTDRQNIEGYLAWKWGVQTALPASHPYYNAIRPFSRTFVPTDIEGCQIWLDPSDASSVTLTGSNVTTIADKSGQGNNFTNASSTLTYTQTLNGLPVVTAPSGVGNNILTGPSISRDPYNHTYFYVYRYPASGTSAVRLIQGTSQFFGHTGTTSPYVEHNNTAFFGTNTSFWFYTTGAPFASADAFYGGNTFVLSCVRQNGVFTITSNGVTTSTNTNASGTGLSTTLLGNITPCTYSLQPGTINGQFGEIIIYNNALTSYQRQTVEGYLCWKWGLRTGGATAPTNYGFLTTHPFYRFPPPSLTPIQPELQLYKKQFDPSDLNPAVWIDPQDTSTIRTDATTGRATLIQNKGTLSDQSFTVSSSTGTTLTLSSANPYFAVGQPVVFTTAPSGLTAGLTYYIFTYTPATPSFQVTATLGGVSAIGSLTGSGAGFVTPSFTIPLIGTGSGISGPLVTSSAIGSGVGLQFLDFSNGGHYRVTGVTVGASPFTALTLTVSPAHNGAIPVGGLVNFTATNGTYPGGASATRAIGPFQILTATITGGTTLTITTLSGHGIGNSESVFLTINTGTFLGGADASGLTGAYTTNASGNTGSTLVLTITSSTNGLMAITDGHVRSNVGTTGPYITQAGTTGSTVILTSYSGRASAGTLSNFVGRLEYGSIPITSATFATTPSNAITLRTPINHGVSSGSAIGLGFNNNFTLPFQNSIGTSTTIGSTCVQFTSATITGNTALTITVTANPFYYLVGGVPTYTGIVTNLRLTLPTGTQFSGGASATGLNGTAYTVQSGSNATTIVLTIASSTNGALNFTGLPGIADTAGSLGANSNILNSTQTTSVGTTGNTIICPLPTFPSATAPITGRLLRTSFPSHTSDNPSLQNTSIFFPVNGYALENPALSTALNTTNTTIVWVSHVSNPIMRNAGIGTTGSPPTTGQQCPVIATASSINNNGGATVNDYAIRLASFAGNAARHSSKYNNGGNFSYNANAGFTDSTSPFRVHTAFFNLTNAAIGDCGRNARGIGTNGGRYDNPFLSTSSGNVPNSLVGGGFVANTLTPVHMRIGGDTNATTTYTTHPLTNFWYEAGVGDILIFNSILNVEERQLVEGYLAQKYATQTNLGSASISANTTATYNITGGSVSGAGPFTITINGTFSPAFVSGSQVTISGATPTGLIGTWTAVTTSTTAVTFLSPNSLTPSSGGTISGITTSTGTSIHPYRLNPNRITPSLNLANTYAQGLAAWFDAANSSTITFVSSNNINSWTNIGGNVSLTLVPNSTNYPTLVQNAQNGLPGVRFAITTGTGTPLGTSFIYPITNFSTLSSNNEFTIITVYKQPTFTSSQVISNIIGSSGDPRLSAYTNTFSYRNTTTEQVKNYTANVNGQTYVNIYYRQGNTLFVRDNGVQDTGATTSGTNLNIPSSIGSIFGVTLGAYVVSTPTVSPFAGDIYEHIIFRYALTDQAIYQIEGYLAWKWGLQASLPTTHPYYRVRP